MTGITDITALVIATLIFLAIPGPGTIKLLTSVGERNGGWRAGIWSTLGLMTGDWVWMVLALSGVAALASTYPKAFDVLRYAGAIYLAWIGLQLIKSRGEVNAGQTELGKAPNRGPAHWFKESMMVSLSNPKVIGFYVAFFPLFIDMSTHDGVATYVRMMAVVLALAFMYCLFLIGIFKSAQQLFQLKPYVGVWLKRMAGLALMGFSVKFALDSH